MKTAMVLSLMVAALCAPSLSARAQETTATTPTPAAEQDSLKIFFGSGSASVAGDQSATLDQAARLFRDGSPLVMIVAGGADTVGDPERNLQLSIRRAQAVADGLVARGIPVERLQVLGRGNSELAVSTSTGVDNRENRVVEISWR